MMTIIVLGGGDSPEREVSLRSAAAVAKGLTAAGFIVQELDPVSGFGILDDLPENVIVFPILHGKDGEDGVIQKELEKRGLPYLGSDSAVAAHCFNKVQARQRLQTNGIVVASGDQVAKETYLKHELASQPHVLKVARGGSSIGTYIVRDPKNIDPKKVSEVFELDDQAVIEEFIEGIEITVPVLDSTALPVIEIRPPEDKEFDYENKYNGATQEICPPESINNGEQQASQRLAELVHKTFECRHLSRVDIIVKKDGTMVVLEINTMPGMTDQSLYPRSAAQAGLAMPELMSKFVDMVKRDYGLKDQRQDGKLKMDQSAV